MYKAEDIILYQVGVQGKPVCMYVTTCVWWWTYPVHSTVLYGEAKSSTI